MIGRTKNSFNLNILEFIQFSFIIFLKYKSVIWNKFQLIKKNILELYLKNMVIDTINKCYSQEKDWYSQNSMSSQLHIEDICFLKIYFQYGLIFSVILMLLRNSIT